MKKFVFDQLIDAENICNFEKEIVELNLAATTQKKIVLYGPRNFGKTSIIKNVVIPHFKKKNPKGFVLFVDLMEVHSKEVIDQRIQTAFQNAFTQCFPMKSLLETAQKLLIGLRPQIEIDPVTQLPQLQLLLQTRDAAHFPFEKILDTIRSRVLQKVPTLLVFDEFQDIARIKGAQGLFRSQFQEMEKSSIIVLGSKHHLLAEMMAAPQAPLAQFGTDIEFKPIDYKKYHAYIQDRFVSKKITITLEHSRFLQDLMFRVPEAINILCNELLEGFDHVVLTQQDILNTCDKILERRQSRLEAFLAHMNEKEQVLLSVIAKNGPILEPTSKKFLPLTQTTARTVSLMVKRLTDKGVLLKTSEGYQVADPFQFYYLRKYR